MQKTYSQLALRQPKEYKRLLMNRLNVRRRVDDPEVKGAFALPRAGELIAMRVRRLYENCQSLSYEELGMAQPLNLVDALQNYLSVTLSREKTISMNMANVDTPGYHSRDIDFQSEFKRAVLTSSDGQGELGSVNLGPASREVPGLMERADGNNVDIDREGLVMAETQLQYQLGTQLIKNQFHQIMTAINGGN